MNAMIPRVVSFLRSSYGPPLVFVVLSAVLYGNSLFGEFVYDDIYFAVQGELREIPYLWETWLRPSLPAMQQFPHYRPLTFFTFSLNFLLFGESPVSFHVVSILLNGIVCWLLFLLMRRLFGSLSLAWITALLFAFMPVHTEAVAYMKARDEILVALFGLAAWIAFLRATDGGRRVLAWSALAGICSLCAFLSKESALVFPGVFGGALLLMRGFRATMRAWMPLALQVGAIGVFFLMHGIAVGWNTMPAYEFLYFGQNPLGYMTPDFVPWTAAELLFIAASLILVPWNLSATYGFQHVPLVDDFMDSWMAPAGLFTLFVLLMLAVPKKTRGTPLGVGAMIFLVLYFPFSKLPFYQGIDFFAERWLYAPSIGLALAGGFVLHRIWTTKREVAHVVIAILLVAYSSVLLPRNRIWQNETALGESMVRDAPDAVISYVFLANNRIGYGRLSEAADLVTVGLQITRDHIPLHHVAAVVAMGFERLDVAEQAVAEAEQLGGNELANVILRSTLLAKQHRFAESLSHLRASRWYDEREYRTRMLLALNLYRLGRPEEAEQYLDWDAYVPSIKLGREEKIRMIESY